jgi:hypothetical protein
MDDINEVMPALADKVAVTLSSRLSSAKDQIKVQKNSEGFLEEVIGVVTGKKTRRQNQVNAHFADLIGGTIEQLTEVMESVALGHRALAVVGGEVRNLQGNLEAVANEVLSIRSDLSNLIDVVDSRLHSLEERLAKNEALITASNQIDHAFNKWKVGALDDLPVISRLYVTLDELWWGNLGAYVTRFPGNEAESLLSDIKNRAKIHLGDSVDVGLNDRIDRKAWFSKPSGKLCSSSHEVPKLVAFLSDWSNEETTPFSFTVNTISEGVEAVAPGVPYLFSADRLAKAMLKENFNRRDKLCA